MSEFKEGFEEVFNKHINEIKSEYNISDKDVYKMKMYLLNKLDEIIVIEKK